MNTNEFLEISSSIVPKRTAITFDDKSWYEIDTEKDLIEAAKIFNKK